MAAARPGAHDERVKARTGVGVLLLGALLLGALLLVAACASPAPSSGQPSAASATGPGPVPTPCGGGAWPPAGQPIIEGIVLVQVDGGTIRVENHGTRDAWVAGPAAPVYAELPCTGWMAQDPGNDSVVVIPAGGSTELAFEAPDGWPAPYRALVSIREQLAGEVVGVAWLQLTAAAAASPGPTAAIPGPTAPPAAEVRVYFTLAGAGDPCTTVAPVVRQVTGPATPEVALRELLRGPTEGEAAVGFTSPFGAGTADALQDVQLASDGVARVSFRDLRAAVPGASSSCGSSALLTALDATLAQFPAIRVARYSIDGDEAAFYDWLGIAPPD